MSTSEQWERIEELFHATLQLEPDERVQYLSQQCVGDPELQSEVESLVAEAELQKNFIEEPAINLALKVMSNKPGRLVGRVIGHYKILKLLGTGGMGEVYLAEDSTLERHVAVKFLARGFDDEWAKAQLKREARAIAQLDHPNICGIYGIEEIGEHNFIVMQYVEGDDLSSLLKQGVPQADKAFDFAEQMARALSAAHSRGIIHRDVKPKNVLVGSDGQVKILDFGLAKYVRANTKTNVSSQLDQTQSGSVVGTVAYMSPEQTRGEVLGPATDVFSLGVFLYEMFSGVNPFLRKTKEETIEALTTYEPPALTNVPRGFAKIVCKCLQKEALARYSDASELHAEIRSLLAERKAADTVKSSVWKPAYIRYYLIAASVIVAAMVITAGLVYVRASRIHSLVILPIRNKSADPNVDYIGPGLTRNLFEKFSYLPRLKVKFPTIPDSTRDNVNAVEVGRALKADSVLSGEILKEGNALKLYLVITDTADGRKAWDKPSM